MKKKVLNYLLLNILPAVLQLVVRFIYLTNKKRFHLPKSGIPNESFILSVWHGDLLMQPFNYKNLRTGKPLKAIISMHKDGEAIRKVVSYLGVEAISGSSSKGGAKALIGAIKTLKKGSCVAITPDGPRGPIYSIADGIVAISQKADAKILCFSSKPTSYWQFDSWDKFILPKPFGTIDFYISDPFDVKDMQMDEAKELIRSKMMENILEK